MVEYTIDEALALLEKNVASATQSLAQVEVDIRFLKEQITTTEVSMYLRCALLRCVGGGGGANGGWLVDTHKILRECTISMSNNAAWLALLRQVAVEMLLLGRLIRSIPSNRNQPNQHSQ
jgi:hypothetical protein